MLPAQEHLTICIAHPADQSKARLHAAHPGVNVIEVRDHAEFGRRVAEGGCRGGVGPVQQRLARTSTEAKFVQSVSAGMNQFDKAALRAKGIRLASEEGVNVLAVAQHAMALILALIRRLAEAWDNQKRRHWRPMAGNFADREDELTSKTLLVLGLGGIGGRLARLEGLRDDRDRRLA